MDTHDLWMALGEGYPPADVSVSHERYLCICAAFDALAPVDDFLGFRSFPYTYGDESDVEVDAVWEMAEKVADAVLKAARSPR